MKKVISRVLMDAKKDKQFIGATIRLKKNGRFSKINAQIFDVKVSQDGEVYVVLENRFADDRQDGRKWQSVAVENIISVRKDGMTYR